MSYISEVQLGSGGTVYPIKDAEARETIEAVKYPCNGRDLTALFADEIAGYSDEWAWIKARINAGDFTGMCHGDYIPLVVNGETLNMQINIDTYYNTWLTDYTKHHIDFISKECYSETVKWNNTNNNNGNSSNGYPFMISNLHDWLDNTLYPLLPTAAKNVIADALIWVEYRYSKDATLEDSTSWWCDTVKLFVPDAFEVWGDYCLGTPCYSAPGSVQYPVFKAGWTNINKYYAGYTEYPCNWWLRSVASGNSTGAAFVYSDGYPNTNYCSNSARVPLCFRIQADA